MRVFTRSLGVVLALVLAIALLPAQERKGRKVAFLVGVGKYKHKFKDLGDAPVNDVNKLAELLEKAGFDVVKITGDEATKDEIEARFQLVLDGRRSMSERINRLGSSDVLLIHLCGHGIQVEATDPDDQQKKEQPFYCGHDALHDDPATMVPLNGLIKKVGRQEVRTLFLVDACRENTDPNIRSRSGIQGANVSLPAGVSILYSCGRNQTAQQDKELGHGLFTWSVLRTLRGETGLKGPVRWRRLVAEVSEAFEEGGEAHARLKGLVQRPVAPSGEADDVPLLTLAAAPEPRDPKPGEERAVEIAPGVKMIFCWIPPGEAQLGSPKAERDAVMKQLDAVMKHLKEPKIETVDKVPHWLASEAEEIRGKYKTKGFWLGKYEVTQQEWAALMDGKNPSPFKGDRLPVEQVSWNDCQEFLTKLNAKGSRKAIFGASGKFVLPHENEWEYACRGGRGNRRPFYFGNELNGTQANCDGKNPFGTATKGDYLKKTTDVGSYASKSPHPWGLCDMHGNVSEWCENLYSSEEKVRVPRGGSWGSAAEECRAARRVLVAPWHRNDLIGFRVCIRLD